LNEKAFIAVVEQAQPDEFADIMARPSAAEEQALRAHLGDDRYQRLHAMALRRNVIRSTHKTKGNVVVLPAIMGSELSVVSPAGTRTQVWVHALRIMDGKLADLRLTEDRSRQAADENVHATGIMKRHYGELLLSLAQNWTVRAFWYDWRRNLDHSAIRLQAQLRDWFDEEEPVHFVGHGMGGLVARLFMRNDPVRWESCLDARSNGVRGGRLVLLGTPHHGSFAALQAIVGIDPVIEKLAQLDLRHDLGEIRNIFNSFVGPYQMLPSHVHDPSMKPLYRSETYAPIVVTQRHLDIASRHHELLGAPPDEGRLINVLGYGQPTVSGIDDLHRLHHPDAYEVSLDGDGRVPLRLGRLSTSSGSPVPTWYVEASHGDLTANGDVLAALEELLETGKSSLLGDMAPAEGDADKQGMAPDRLKEGGRIDKDALGERIGRLRSRVLRQGVDATINYVTFDERQAEELVTRDTLSTLARRPSARVEGPIASGHIKLAVEHTLVDADDLPSGEDRVDAIAVGHYERVRPQAAERALDQAISRALHRGQGGPRNGGLTDQDLLLTQYTERGIIRGELGQPFFVTDPRDDARVIAVAGMGPPARFGMPELTVLARELCWSLGRMGKKHLATVLIGAGNGNLTEAEAIEAWILGVEQAVASSLDDDDWVLRQITFLEADGKKAANMNAAILSQQHRLCEQRRLKITYNELSPEKIQEISGKNLVETVERPHNAEPEDPAPTRISYGLDYGTYRFGAITKDASIPERAIPLDRALVDQANNELAAEWDLDMQVQRGRFLERLLIPHDLRAELYSAVPIVLSLDSTTARIHWELLAQPELFEQGDNGPTSEPERSFLATNRGLTRQLRTTFAPPPEPPPPPRRVLRVLVVADPAEDAPLRGAQEEGVEIADLFTAFNRVHTQPGESRVEVVSLLGPRQATRTNVLRHLMLQQFDVLHFAGHCTYNPDPTASGWLFSGNQLVSANELNRIDRIPKFIFSNACESGVTPDRSEQRSVELAPSFAESFFGRGVSNFVCTAWPVNDVAARTFALTLYMQLLGLSRSDQSTNLYIAQTPQPMYKAMREARRTISNRSDGSHTWGAYQHYGNPFLRFFSPPAAGAPALAATRESERRGPPGTVPTRAPTAASGGQAPGGQATATAGAREETAAPPSGRRHALLIGVDEYPLLQGADLRGCVNDVELMGSLLRDSFGFADEAVVTLRNQEATQAGIQAAFDALIRRVGRNDLVVVHYSGHGSQMTDREGDEADGLDETIVPHDSGRAPNPNRDISDDQIYAWLLQLSELTPYVTVIFDCCHSGTVSRDPFGAAGRWVEPDLRPVDQLPPSPVTSSRSASARQAGPSGWLPLSERYVLIAGCRDTESSYEHAVGEDGGEVHHGALTYFLCRELCKAVPGTTYRDVFEPASIAVIGVQPRQHPQMEGASDRELFGTREITPIRHVRVQHRAGGTVVLAGGAAHGMTTGSRWTIHPPGTKAAGDAAPPLGRVEVTTVRAVTSDAHILEEANTNAIVEDARAVEEAHAFGPMRLAVDLAGDETGGGALENLRARIERSPLLAQAGAGERADARIHLLESRGDPAPHDPVPQLGPLAEPTWAVVGQGGGLAMPPRPASEPEAVTTIVENLEKLARYANALALENPDTANMLAGKLELTLLRRDAEGTWSRAQPDRASGRVIYQEGDLLGFEITNRHDQPVYVSVLDFGLSGAVSLLYPPGGASQPLSSDATIRFGEREGEQTELYIPEVVPQMTAGGPGDPAEATESLKLFATTHPADFSPLFQEGVRATTERSDRDTPLGQLLAMAQTGTGTRDPRPVQRPPGEDWTTVVRPFTLRRRAAGTPLRPDGDPLPVGRVVLRTPGLEGAVVLHPGVSARTRGIDQATDELRAALAAEGLKEQETVEITGAREVGNAARSTPLEEPALELVVPEPRPDQGQLLLATDEAGVVTWNFARDSQGQVAATRGMGTRTYLIARRPAMPAAEPGTRGLLDAVGSKLLEVLVFPLLDPIVGEVGEHFARRWESRYRPYRLRSFGPDDYRRDDVGELDPEAWRRLASGRALLFVHGTFSRAHTAFGGLSTALMTQLDQLYGGRVFAFDHFTLCDSPRQNVEHFLGALPNGTTLDLDIICHSRGGLVSRILAERQKEYSLGSGSLKVGKVVMVAVPNAGTVLAHADHLGDMIDTYTNLLQFLPDNPVTDVIGPIVTVAKQLAVGIVKGLDGLTSMVPDGDFQRWLNVTAADVTTRYFALAANYEPNVPGFLHFAQDRLFDKLFKSENDLVVPTQGVWDANGSSLFPVSDRHLFPAGEAVDHSGFFRNATAQKTILGWLTG
jgi:hypothetical protein